MKALPRKFYRARRWQITCLIILSVVYLAISPGLATTAQQAGFQMQVEEGKTADITLNMTNTCQQSQNYSVESSVDYLRPLEPANSILIAPGVKRPLTLRFDAAQLKSGVYNGTVTWRRVSDSGRCTQNRTEIPFQLTVTEPPQPVPSPQKTPVRPTPTDPTPPYLGGTGNTLNFRNRLGCCTCLGERNTLDLSTVAANNWRVDGKPVEFPTPINGGWNLPRGSAQWVSTTADGTKRLPAGDYEYTLSFEVPNCTISQTITLTGTYGADNKASVFLDGNLLSTCTSGNCFNTSSPPPPIKTPVTVGLHKLTVKVHNDGNVSGMFVNAQLAGACPKSKEIFKPGDLNGTIRVPPTLAAGVTMGTVTSTDGSPLSDVKLQIKGKTVTSTNGAGFYQLDSSGFKEDTAVTFSADGFIDNIRILRPGTDTFFPVSLAPIRNKVSFQAEKGGEFDFKGAVMKIPPAAFVDGKGKTVTGPVDLEFTLLDVTNRADLAAAMEFRGRMLDGKIKPLQSYGIFDWRVRNKNQEVLAVAPGSKIGLSVSIPPKLVKDAPQRMGIFSTDRLNGIWQQVGWFQLQPEPLTYSGTLTTMGGSNLDIAGWGTCITIQVVNPDWPGYVAGYNVQVIGTGYYAASRTDSSGRACVIVKQGDSITITATKGTGTGGDPTYNTPPDLEVHMIAPMTNSMAADCGDPIKCPLVKVEVWVVLSDGEH